MSVGTATVETLTAEVRVLMVGSRQVTLSVYRQLDTVPYGDLDPYGRVNDGKKTSRDLHVVGRHRETGVLARAIAPRVPRGPQPGPRAWRHWLAHREDVQRSSRGILVAESSSTVAGDRLGVVWDYDPIDSRGNKTWGARSGCKCDVDLTVLEAEWREESQRQLGQGIRDLKAELEAKSLPLIVLAGLR